MKYQRWERLIFIVIASVGLVSASVGAEEALDDKNSASLSESANAASPDADCFVLGEFRRWIVIDDRHLYVEGSNDDTKILITTKNNCRGMHYAQKIEASQKNAKVCKSGDRIKHRSAGVRQSCSIGDIEAVASSDEAKALAK